MKKIIFFREAFDGEMLVCPNDKFESINDSISNDDIIKEVISSVDKWDNNATHFKIQGEDKEKDTDFIKLPINYLYIMDFNTGKIYCHKIKNKECDDNGIVLNTEEIICKLGFNLDEVNYMFTSKERYIENI